jgi:serine phosphatase RsbU (regulator of sigma subunit)
MAEGQEQKKIVTGEDESLLSSLFELLDAESVFALNTKFEYIAFNSAHKKQIAEIAGKEVKIGDKYFEIARGSVIEEKVKKNFDRALQGLKFSTVEEIQGNEKRQIFHNRFSPISESGANIGFIVVSINITAKKETEKIWEFLLKISEEAHKAENISELVKHIHKLLSELINARNFYICLYDEKTNKYFFPYFVDEYDVIDTAGVEFSYDYQSGITTYDLSRTLTDYVRRSGKALNFSVQTEIDLFESGEIELFGTPSPSLLGIPLKLENKTIGVMTVQSYDKKGVYTKKDEDLLMFVSDHLTRAIENKRIKESIDKQHQLVLQQKNDITDSINYAKYIQSSILPRDEKLDLCLREHFVIYKPKDIVSGDFYWITTIENKSVVAAVDCTGHGVPGAFMSMLGAAFLNEIINKEYITHPGVILRRLRKEVIRSLQQKGETGEQKDGMDIALCVIDYENMKLQFAGANNPLYIVRNSKYKDINDKKSMESGGVTLFEFKGDHMPIGIHDKMDNFAMHEIDLIKEDSIYIFTDGFADQFGGEDHKKLQYKNFKRIILDHCSKPMKEQKFHLEEELRKWQGVNQQIDDILVLGIKIN